MKRKTFNVQRSTFNVELETIASRGAEADGTYSAGKYDLEERLLEFTAAVIRLSDSLPDTKAGNHIAVQVMRSGTSPLANHGEVQAAESRKDFLHKLGICLKEVRETKRWLRLIHRLELTNPEELRSVLDELDQLIRIFSASIRTAERNSR
jgi:four helix bundle protein